MGVANESAPRRFKSVTSTMKIGKKKTKFQTVCGKVENRLWVCKIGCFSRTVNESSPMRTSGRLDRKMLMKEHEWQNFST